MEQADTDPDIKKLDLNQEILLRKKKKKDKKKEKSMEKKSKFLKNLKKELEETLGRKKLENNPKAKKLLKVIHHLQKQVSIKKNKVKSISEIVRVEGW